MIALSSGDVVLSLRTHAIHPGFLAEQVRRGTVGVIVIEVHDVDCDGSGCGPDCALPLVRFQLEDRERWTHVPYDGRDWSRPIAHGYYDTGPDQDLGLLIYPWETPSPESVPADGR